MSSAEGDPFRVGLAAVERQADALHAELHAGDDAAAWRFKWQHSRFRGCHVDDVRAAIPELGLADAREVVAHDHSFATWDDLVAFTDAVKEDGPARRFETAVDAVVDGDLETLRRLLRDDPALARARSTRRHHATLLHYVAANGVEDARQRTPGNAVEVARLLLDHGAEADALADMYDSKCTTMSMLVSSSHPAERGVQVPLAELLVDHGASLDGSDTESPLMTALTFGYIHTAEALVRRGAPVRDLATAAGLGRVDEVRRLLPDATPEQRHAALALAAQHGHADVVALLLDAGEDPDRYNPEGHHAHATPLHHAAGAGHGAAVRVMVERGARLDMRDTIYDATPLDWALHGRQLEIAGYLQSAAGDRGTA